MLQAQRAVLPKEVPFLIVGGIGPETLSIWLASGANRIRPGSGLYMPGRSAAEARERVRDLCRDTALKHVPIRGTKYGGPDTSSAREIRTFRC